MQNILAMMIPFLSWSNLAAGDELRLAPAHFARLRAPSSIASCTHYTHPDLSNIHRIRLRLQLIRRRFIRGVFLRILWRGQAKQTSQK